MPKIEFKYCLTCGREVVVQSGVHEKATHNDGHSFGTIYNYVECQGPFAECPPPDDLQEDWQDKLIAPSHDEYFQVSQQYDYDIEMDEPIMYEMI